MAEFLDVLIGHMADEPPWIAFEDDHGNSVGVSVMISADFDEYGNYVERYRIQRDEIEKL